jgi:flagellar assembly factor FliW
MVNTVRFGALEYDPAAAVEFPLGIPGFERERRFVLVEQERLAPLVFLQSLDTPGLCFPAVPAGAVDAEYRLAVAREDLEVLGLDPARHPAVGTEVLCLAIVAAQEGPPTANLLAPVVIHLARRVGVQAVRADARYSHRHPLGEPSLGEPPRDGRAGATAGENAGGEAGPCW